MLTPTITELLKKFHTTPRQAEAAMATARLYKQLSYSGQLPVGCAVTLDGRVVSTGYNGTESGHPNSPVDENGHDTKDFIHAEDNALGFLESVLDPNFYMDTTSFKVVVFVTTAPCKKCATLMDSSLVGMVIYDEPYKCEDGINDLISRRIPVFSFAEFQKELKNADVEPDQLSYPPEQAIPCPS